MRAHPEVAPKVVPATDARPRGRDLVLCGATAEPLDACPPHGGRHACSPSCSACSTCCCSSPTASPSCRNCRPGTWRCRSTSRWSRRWCSGGSRRCGRPTSCWCISIVHATLMLGIGSAAGLAMSIYSVVVYAGRRQGLVFVGAAAGRVGRAAGAGAAGRRARPRDAVPRVRHRAVLDARRVRRRPARLRRGSGGAGCTCSKPNATRPPGSRWPRSAAASRASCTTSSRTR